MNLLSRQISVTTIRVAFIRDDLRPWPIPIRQADKNRREIRLVPKARRLSGDRSRRLQGCLP